MREPNYTSGAKAFLLSRFRERSIRIPLSELYRVPSPVLAGCGVPVSHAPDAAPSTMEEKMR